MNGHGQVGVNLRLPFRKRSIYVETQLRGGQFWFSKLEISRPGEDRQCFTGTVLLSFQVQFRPIEVQRSGLLYFDNVRHLLLVHHLSRFQKKKPNTPSTFKCYDYFLDEFRAVFLPKIGRTSRIAATKVSYFRQLYIFNDKDALLHRVGLNVHQLL